MSPQRSKTPSANSPRLLIVAIALGVFASVMSTSMLSIAFPELVQSFRISYTTLQLRNILFFSIFAVGLPFFGKIADRVGARRQLFAGIGLFCAATVASGFARNWHLFLACQALQALADLGLFGGAARMLPNLVRVGRHVNFFLQLSTLENYLVAEYVLG